MLKLKSINYAFLLVTSPLIIVGCGGASGGDTRTKENSASEVAIKIEIQASKNDKDISSRFATSNQTPKHATWVPEELSKNTSNKIFTKSQVSSLLTNATIIEKIISNGDNKQGWKVYDQSPTGATVESVHNQERGNNVIKVDGDSINNGYLIGYSWADNTSWNDRENKTIKWSMNFTSEYMIYVRVSTRKGYRYLYYTANNENYGISGYDAPHYIHNGLGTTSNDGTWRTFSRDLTADLKRHERDNSIISVDGFYVRGSGLLDDIELLKTDGQRINEVIYENGSNNSASNWSVYDNPTEEGSITNENDTIKLSGKGLENGYILGGWSNSTGWKNTINKEISWDMKYNEDYIVYLSIETAQGHRFITYTPMSIKTCNTFRSTGKLPDGIYGLKHEENYDYIHIGLCPETKNGTWQTVARNLEQDLKKYEPTNSLVSVNAFLVRGSGNIDNVSMYDTNKDGDYDNATN